MITTITTNDQQYCSDSNTCVTRHDDIMSKLVFSPSEALVQEVHNNPTLYHATTAAYKNIIIKDNIWKEISIKKFSKKSIYPWFIIETTILP